MKDVQRLIEKCLAGDRRAHGQLYEAFAPYSLAVIRRYGIGGGREADLLQEIFIEVFRDLNRYNFQKASFKTWLRQITVFRIIDHQRKGAQLYFKSIEGSAGFDVADDSEPLQHLPPSYLLEAIAQLPPGYRTVFNLYAVEGFSHDRIAKLLDISAAGSRSQYHRARKLLQKMLKKNLMPNEIY
ncbi:MAG: RNA polymerase sigma factor [Bacteroidota bacterium]